MDDDIKLINQKKKILLKAIGEIVLEERTKLKKGINKFSFEYDIGNGLLSRLEHGSTDAKITTLWKLANAFNLSFSQLALKIENKLPKDFNFYE